MMGRNLMTQLIPGMEPINEGDEFLCVACGEVFTSSWSDEEATEEAKEQGFLDGQELAIVCDACFKKTMH